MPSVLIVDDDLDLLEMMGLILSHSPMRVHCLSDGRKLFETVSTFKPDVIVMDIYLGPVDGRQLCKELKTSTQYNNIPVILYSAGIITPESITLSLADDFMVKPFNLDDLMARINRLLPAETN